MLYVDCYSLLSLSSTDMADPQKIKLRTTLRLGGLMGFVGGFLLAYQRSSGMFTRALA